MSYSTFTNSTYLVVSYKTFVYTDIRHRYYNGTLRHRFDHRNITSGNQTGNPNVCQELPSVVFDRDAILRVGVPNPDYSKKNAVAMRLVAWNQKYNATELLLGSDKGAAYNRFQSNSESR